MSRTRRFFSKRQVEAVLTEDGTYAVYLDGELDRQNLNDYALEHEMCVRFGYCGYEFTDIKEDLRKTGKAIRALGGLPPTIKLRANRDHNPRL